MTFWHPVVDPTAKGATTDSNLQDIEHIRLLPEGPTRTAAINAMITANIPLVMLKVESYTRLHAGYSHIMDDMVSAGLLAVTTSVQTLATAATPEDGGNPSSYIGQSIIHAIARLAENDTKQQIPEGYVPPYPLVVDPMEIVDVLDLLTVACQTPVDVTIIDMRQRGCTDQEIADRLDTSRTAVRMQRHEIMQRYDELVRESL